MDFWAFLDRNGFGVFLFCVFCGPTILDAGVKTIRAIFRTPIVVSCECPCRKKATESDDAED